MSSKNVVCYQAREIIKPMVSAGKTCNPWKGRENLETDGKGGKILKPMERVGKSWNRWNGRENVNGFSFDPDCLKIGMLAMIRSLENMASLFFYNVN